jgi:xylulokinase
VGPALGAARLAQQALNPEVTVPTPTLVQRHQPDPDKRVHYQSRRETFSILYQQLLPLMK